MGITLCTVNGIHSEREGESDTSESDGLRQACGRCVWGCCGVLCKHAVECVGVLWVSVCEL